MRERSNARTHVRQEKHHLVTKATAGGIAQIEDQHCGGSGLQSTSMTDKLSMHHVFYALPTFL